MFWWCKASTTDQVRVQSGRGTLPMSLCMASMPAHVERKPWAGTFDSLTWAPAPCLACEMVPFFPNKNALHPCTLTVYLIYISLPPSFLVRLMDMDSWRKHLPEVSPFSVCFLRTKSSAVATRIPGDFFLAEVQNCSQVKSLCEIKLGMIHWWIWSNAISIQFIFHSIPYRI